MNLWRKLDLIVLLDLKKNKINDDFKNTVQKDYNLAILEKTIRNIIYDYHKDDTNIKVIEKFVVERKIVNNNFVLMFNSFLDINFSEIIKIFNMPKEEYKTKFDLENNFLLECKKIKIK